MTIKAQKQRTRTPVDRPMPIISFVGALLELPPLFISSGSLGVGLVAMAAVWIALDVCPEVVCVGATAGELGRTAV